MNNSMIKIVVAFLTGAFAMYVWEDYKKHLPKDDTVEYVDDISGIKFKPIDFPSEEKAYEALVRLRSIYEMYGTIRLFDIFIAKGIAEPYTYECDDLIDIYTENFPLSESTVNYGYTDIKGFKITKVDDKYYVTLNPPKPLGDIYDTNGSKEDKEVM